MNSLFVVLFCFLGLPVFLFSQNQTSTKAKNILLQSNITGKKLIKEYYKIDTIFTATPKLVNGQKLKYGIGQTIRDVTGTTFSITEVTKELVKLQNGNWQFCNEGLNHEPVFLHANSKGEVFAVCSGKGFGWKLYKLKDNTWIKISENFAAWPLTTGADGNVYCLKEFKDGNNKQYKAIHIWKEDSWLPIEYHNNQQVFYEDNLKIYITPNSTIYAAATQKNSGTEQLVIYEWKNKNWKKIGEFTDLYLASATKGTDLENRFYVTYLKNNMYFLRRWDGSLWVDVPYPLNTTKYGILSNNLTGDLFFEMPSIEQRTFYKLEENNWTKLEGIPKHILPKYNKEVFVQKEGYYYENKYGFKYNLGNNFIIKKRAYKVYELDLPFSARNKLSPEIIAHLAKFKLITNNDKLGLTGFVKDYPTIHPIFDSIQIKENYYTQNEYLQAELIDYKPVGLALFKNGKEIYVDILSLKLYPNLPNEPFNGLQTRIYKCIACDGTGVITKKTLEGYTMAKSKDFESAYKYKTSSGDIVEVRTKWTETTPSESIYKIKTGLCYCGGKPIKRHQTYYYDALKEEYQ